MVAEAIWFPKNMKLKILLLAAFVLGINYHVSHAYDCPPDEYISPCKCRIPPYYLVCEDIDDVEVLKRVAKNMQGVPSAFAKLWIANSTLQYIPKELLETISTKELHLKNVNLQSIFLEPPTTLQLFEKIHLNHVTVMRGVIWSLFSRMQNLKYIVIYDLPINVLKKDFGEYVPHTLKELEFLKSRTKRFEKEALQNFKDLEKLEVYDCRLEEIHRDYFPVPFNVENFYIARNKLRTIPDDLFTNMPNLKEVILENNQIATIPESAFGGIYGKLEILLLAGNPLKCDCSLRWIVIKKPQFIEGTCASPKIMHGKELKNLNPEDFFC